MEGCGDKGERNEGDDEIGSGGHGGDLNVLIDDGVGRGDYHDGTNFPARMDMGVHHEEHKGRDPAQMASHGFTRMGTNELRSDFEGFDFFEGERHGDGGGGEAENGDEDPGEDEAPGLAAVGDSALGETHVHGEDFRPDDKDDVNEAEEKTEGTPKAGDDAGGVIVAAVGGRAGGEIGEERADADGDAAEGEAHDDDGGGEQYGQPAGNAQHPTGSEHESRV